MHWLYGYLIFDRFVMIGWMVFVKSTLNVAQDQLMIDFYVKGLQILAEI